MPQRQNDTFPSMAAVDYSAVSLPASLGRVCLACYSGTDYSVAWRVRFNLRSTDAGPADHCRGPTDLRRWQRRSLAAAPSYAASNPATGHSFGSFSGILNSIAIAKSDYDVFERLLGGIQTAYPAEDLSALRAMVTPEMPSYFSEELAANARRGLVNHVTDVKLLQGDLAEAWREGRNDYATVAMKLALKDSMVERASGRIVEGGEQTRHREANSPKPPLLCLVVGP
jgi:predicted lipid-binding transport protein (Tim44 family)